MTASWPIIASTTNRISSGDDRVADRDGLRHHVGVDAEPAGGVDDDDVVTHPAGVLDRRPRATATGSPTPLPGSGAKTSTPAWPPTTCSCCDRVGALQVGRDEQRRVPLLLQPAAELAGEGRLTGALQAGEHDDGRRVLGEGERAGLAAEDRDELLVDDLDDLLRRVERLADLGAARPLLDRGDERLDGRQRDVGLEQRDPDLARGGVDVGLGEPTLAAQRGEDRLEPVGEGVEHRSRPGYAPALSRDASCSPYPASAAGLASAVAISMPPPAYIASICSP